MKLDMSERRGHGSSACFRSPSLAITSSKASRRCPASHHLETNIPEICKCRTMLLVDPVPKKLENMRCHADRPRQSAKSNVLDPTTHSIGLLICPHTLP